MNFLCLDCVGRRACRPRAFTIQYCRKYPLPAFGAAITTHQPQLVLVECYVLDIICSIVHRAWNAAISELRHRGALNSYNMRLFAMTMFKQSRFPLGKRRLNKAVVEIANSWANHITSIWTPATPCASQEQGGYQALQHSARRDITENFYAPSSNQCISCNRK
jgi:hypothetical protein